MSEKLPRNSKEYDIQDRLKHKDVFCVSNRWVKWAKNYINRATRRKGKMKKYE